MKVEIQIDPNLDEPVAVLRVPGLTEEAEALAARLREEAVLQPFTVYRDREAVRVSRSMVLRFYAEDKGVLCQTGRGVLDLTLAGTIKMTLEGGTVCWVSRRYVKKIKQALGL